MGSSFASYLYAPALPNVAVVLLLSADASREEVFSTVRSISPGTLDFVRLSQFTERRSALFADVLRIAGFELRMPIRLRPVTPPLLRDASPARPAMIGPQR